MPGGVQTEVRTYQMFINGAWVDSKSAKTFPVYDPSIEEIIAEVPEDDSAAAARHPSGYSPDSALDRAETFDSWAHDFYHPIALRLYDRAVGRFRDGRIVLPTFGELADPSTMPSWVREGLADVEPDDPHPLNLFRVHWFNGADRRSLVDVPEHVVLPPELNGPKFLADMMVAGLSIDGATVTVPDSPGLGVQIDERAIRSRAIRR